MRTESRNPKVSSSNGVSAFGFQTDAAGHLGAVGNRVRLMVKVTSRRGVDGPFGPFYTIRMKCGQSELEWRSSSNLACSLRVGDRIELAATVKEHQVGPLGQAVTVLANVRQPAGIGSGSTAGVR